MRRGLMSALALMAATVGIGGDAVLVPPPSNPRPDLPEWEGGSRRSRSKGNHSKPVRRGPTDGERREARKRQRQARAKQRRSR